MVHPMKECLDARGLHQKSRDREFTTFLDLKSDYHHEFINRLREHVQINGYQWGDVERSVVEREACASSFVETWGKLYWGTESNRQQHLLQESLDDPRHLCVYPDRRKEIVRAIMILLERKAKGVTRNQARQSLGSTETPSAAAARHVPAPSPMPNLSQGGKDNKAKRRRSDDSDQSSFVLDDEPKRLKPQRVSNIRPFRSIIDLRGEGAKQSKPSAAAHVAAPAVKNCAKAKEINSMSDTKFLVTSSNQSGMAPIWIPFQDFQTASSFISHIADECTLRYWDSHIKALSNWQGDTPLPAAVAASVKFEWSDFEIRIRPGKDQDWAFFMEALQRAWKHKSEDPDGGHGPLFKIYVILHVMDKRVS
ncbi:hypothetical protein EYZ11_009815 [Aspergillus tanneri]|uniref:Uncharacterized protein n=1 Tax=Aspergillus tanneri TaxID=1220188 RepID=A0A4S3J934_9EURO|nr:uncharacterized protein ATNIH1004_010303 [Aspergillus tanneri]KAA8643534.1 hypothetical protein ATNIH1004_010303 [Aspergillus tanneri]THC90727.1 hypothetical protein EYZ11_009815 [Aspergillus tanneri]